MASNKTGMTGPDHQPRDLGGVMIKMLAAGVAGGAALILGAKAFGELLLEAQVERYNRLEPQREADREEVRRITQNEIEADFEVDE